tara:strand:- start:103 stop:630 length:528 start_codon:yes stop_codon:yes gene_type:complete
MKITKHQLKQIIKEELSQVLDEQDVEPIETADIDIPDVEPTTDVNIPDVKGTWNAKDTYEANAAKYVTMNDIASEYQGIVQSMTNREGWYKDSHLQGLDAGALDGSPDSIGRVKDTISNLESYYSYDEKTPILVNILKNYLGAQGAWHPSARAISDDPEKLQAVMDYAEKMGINL